jgi:hypothetical protein
VLSCPGTVQDKYATPAASSYGMISLGLFAGYRLATGPGAVSQAQARDSNRKTPRRITGYARHHYSRRSRFRSPRRVGARSPRAFSITQRDVVLLVFDRRRVWGVRRARFNIDS